MYDLEAHTMELWSSAHVKTLLPALAVMLILSIILRILLRKKDLKIRMIPVQIIAVLLLLLEVGKQAVSFSRGYDLYHIPLHFCSLLLFTLPAMAFYKGEICRSGMCCGHCHLWCCFLADCHLSLSDLQRRQY